MKSRILLFCFLFSALLSYAQFQKASFQINGVTLPYQVSFPENYDGTKKYPLLVFLHGAGERGNDNEGQLVHGKDFLLQNTQTKYPAIVIAPQCPADNFWSNVSRHSLDGKTSFDFGVSETPSVAMETLIALVNDWLSSGKVDLSQVYVGGLSMGGMGTFELLWRMPDTFAAAFPICGGGDLSKVGLFAKYTAVWIFHGADDSVVPVQHSREMYAALKSSGCDTKYTEYEGVNHNSWDNVFLEKDLFGWLFDHK